VDSFISKDQVSTKAGRLQKWRRCAPSVAPARRLQRRRCRFVKGKTMLYTIVVILLVLWLLGLVSSYTLGGFIHVLLVIAVVVLLLQLISGRRGPPL
jgi:hypothetical protein